jgi:eukaryotic-like serine/threonine-protein kinase
MATCPTCRAQYPDDVATCAQDGQSLVPDHLLPPLELELSPGTLVGEYRIEGKLGEGGFGTVYRSVHPLIGKAAAIKVLSREFSANPQIVSRFIAEARAVNQIRHRNIIDIFSFGVLDDGRQYYVMELLEGLTLDAHLRERGRLEPGEAIPILAKIARALDAAHAAGIAHRDLKPENVFLVHDEDAGLFPKLLDFGIAKLLGDSSGAQHKTRTGLAMGTPLYMSPEQCRGKNVDHRTDIYSFGIMAHELLTGCLPFDAEDAIDLLIKQTSEAAPPMSTVCPDVPQALDGPVLRMLEKEPAKRPRTLGEAVEALASAAKGAGIEVTGVATRPLPARSAGSSVRVVTDAGAGGMGKTEVFGSAQDPADAKAAGSRQGSTDLGLQTSVIEPRTGEGRGGARPAVFVVAALVVAVLGAGAFFALRSPSGARTDAEPLTSATPQVLRPPPADSATQPVVAPTPSATQAAAPLPADYEIAIATNAKDVETWLEGKKIGAAPGPIRLPHGKTSKLKLKAKGYVDLERDVPDNSASPLELKLVPVPKGISKDLVNPF